LLGGETSYKVSGLLKMKTCGCH